MLSLECCCNAVHIWSIFSFHKLYHWNDSDLLLSLLCFLNICFTFYNLRHKCSQHLTSCVSVIMHNMIRSRHMCTFWSCCEARQQLGAMQTATRNPFRIYFFQPGCLMNHVTHTLKVCFQLQTLQCDIKIARAQPLAVTSYLLSGPSRAIDSFFYKPWWRVNKNTFQSFFLSTYLQQPAQMRPFGWGVPSTRRTRNGRCRKRPA